MYLGLIQFGTQTLPVFLPAFFPPWPVSRSGNLAPKVPSLLCRQGHPRPAAAGISWRSLSDLVSVTIECLAFNCTLMLCVFHFTD